MSPELLARYHEAPDPKKYAATIARANRIISAFWKLNIIGAENVPQEGGGIVAFTHRSYIDPWILGSAVPRFASGFAKRELLRPYYFGLGRVYFTNRGFSFVDRKNPSSSDLEPIYDTVSRGRLVAIAPEGTSKNRGKEIGDIKVGIGRIAIKLASSGVDCPIVPVAIGSENLGFRGELPVVIGEVIKPPHYDISTISDRRVASAGLNEQLRASLQSLNDQVWELQESAEG